MELEAKGARPKAGGLTDEEKKIVMDAQKELGNRWMEIAWRLPGRSGNQIKKWWHSQMRWKNQKGEGGCKEEVQTEGPITEEEKRIVVEAQKELGNKWLIIAKRLPGRSPKQISNWWHHNLKWEIGWDEHKKGPFREKETRVVTKAQKELGNRSAKIAEHLPSQSGRQVRNWWNNQIKTEKQQRKRRRGEMTEAHAATEEETRFVVDPEQKLVCKLNEIAERLPGLSESHLSESHFWNRWRTQVRLEEQKRERRCGERVRTSVFTEDEWRIVTHAQELENKSADIMEQLPGRSGSQIRNRAVVNSRSDCRKVGGDRMEENKPSTLESFDGMSYNEVIHKTCPLEMTPPGNGTTYEGTTKTAEMQSQNIAQEEQLRAATTNLHTRQNINGTTFQQVMQILLHQLTLPRNGTDHEMMIVDAIDQAISQEVQRAASANNLHVQTMVEKDQRIAALERIIAEKDLEIMYLKSRNANSEAKGNEAKRRSLRKDEREGKGGT